MGAALCPLTPWAEARGSGWEESFQVTSWAPRSVRRERPGVGGGPRGAICRGSWGGGGVFLAREVVIGPGGGGGAQAREQTDFPQRLAGGGSGNGPPGSAAQPWPGLRPRGPGASGVSGECRAQAAQGERSRCPPLPSSAGWAWRGPSRPHRALVCVATHSHSQHPQRPQPGIQPGGLSRPEWIRAHRSGEGAAGALPAEVPREPDSQLLRQARGRPAGEGGACPGPQG